MSSIFTQLEKYMYCMKVYPKAHLIFAGECRSSVANMPEKGLTEFERFLFLCLCCRPADSMCSLNPEPQMNWILLSVIHSHMLIAAAEHAFIQERGY